MEVNLARTALPPRPAWRMSLEPQHYDRRPLSPAERAALAVVVDRSVPINSAPRRAAEAVLDRLVRPLRDVYALRHQSDAGRSLFARGVFGQMHQRGRAFWQWTTADWHAAVRAAGEDGAAPRGLTGGGRGLRPFLLDLAYLLCGFAEFRPLWTATGFYPMARAVFGADHLDGQIARLDRALAGEGTPPGITRSSSATRRSPSRCSSTAAPGSTPCPGRRSTAPWPACRPMRRASSTGR